MLFRVREIILTAILLLSAIQRCGLQQFFVFLSVIYSLREKCYSFSLGSPLISGLRGNCILVFSCEVHLGLDRTVYDLSRR